MVRKREGRSIARAMVASPVSFLNVKTPTPRVFRDSSTLWRPLEHGSTISKASCASNHERPMMLEKHSRRTQAQAIPASLVSYTRRQAIDAETNRPLSDHWNTYLSSSGTTGRSLSKTKDASWSSRVGTNTIEGFTTMGTSYRSC